jgi:hypothetical protein
MTEIENRCVEIKATLQKLTDVKCSSTARLVAVLIACGIESTTEIAKLIGKTDRMVRSARKELSACGNLLPETDCRRKPVAGNQLPEAETDCRSRAHAPAQMESPSGISLSQEVEDTPLPPKRDFWGRPIEGPEADLDFDPEKVTLRVSGGLLAESLDDFDGDRRALNLALKEIAPQLQPKSSIALLAQYRRHLSRIARQRHDQQKRYDDAKAAKVSPQEASLAHQASLLAGIRARAAEAVAA